MASPRDADTDEHLSQIATAWTAIFEAHAGTATVVQAAQQRLLERYQGAIYRYLLAATRDRDAADDLFQEFALRFVRGDFRRADPERGRFRDFLKTSLYHLIVDHQRRRQKQQRPLGLDTPEPAADDAPGAADDEEFLAVWKAGLMNRAWAALARAERETGEPLHTVLRHRTDHPEARSAAMAEQLGARLGKAVSAEWVRKRLYLARRRFTDILLEEVERSLDESGPDGLEQELIDLGLWDYCREALQRRRGQAPPDAEGDSA